MRRVLDRLMNNQYCRFLCFYLLFLLILIQPVAGKSKTQSDRIKLGNYSIELPKNLVYAQGSGEVDKFCEGAPFHQVLEPGLMTENRGRLNIDFSKPDPSNCVSIKIGDLANFARYGFSNEWEIDKITKTKTAHFDFVCADMHRDNNSEGKCNPTIGFLMIGTDGRRKVVANTAYWNSDKLKAKKILKSFKNVVKSLRRQ